jgi:hypothetical protein
MAETLVTDRPGQPGAGPLGQAAPAAAAAPVEPDIRQLVSPVHSDQAPWQLLDSAEATGTGACAAVRLASVIDLIQERFEEVRSIESFRPSGPRGVTMMAGPPVRLGEPPPPATGTAAYVLGYRDERSFGVTFFQGNRCLGEQCQQRQYWYFETDEGCRPRWVGHHRVEERAGGRSGTCLDVSGTSLWNFPGHIDPRQRCDVDWSPQDISGTRRAFSVTGGPTCGKSAAFVPVEITISQQSDRALATVTVQGTGVPFLDGRPFTGQVERQRFSASHAETPQGPCPIRRELKFDLDFEGPSNNGLPGGFGLVDISERALAPCASPPPDCSASLHLIHAN